MSPARLDLHIDELVLDGLEGLDAEHVRTVVQREMTHLLAARGVPPSLSERGHAASLDGGAFQVTPGASADAIGAQIAQAVYGGLSR